MSKNGRMKLLAPFPWHRTTGFLPPNTVPGSPLRWVIRASVPERSGPVYEEGCREAEGFQNLMRRKADCESPSLSVNKQAPLSLWTRPQLHQQICR
jgi:hypothetical protein